METHESARSGDVTVARGDPWPLRTEPMTPNPECTVYYDSACPVCRREIAHYRRRRGAGSVAWVDAATCDEAALGPGLDRARALARFHVRDADGVLVSGPLAFVAIWRRLPAFAWLAPVASWRPVLALLEAAYAVFLRARRRWRPDDAAQAAPAAPREPAR